MAKMGTLGKDMKPQKMMKGMGKHEMAEAMNRKVVKVVKQSKPKRSSGY